jgi:hypothetical protein
MMTPGGVPLADYMGDAVFEINILPNTARLPISRVARGLSFTGQPLHILQDFTSSQPLVLKLRGKPRSRSPTPSSIRALCWG